MIGMDFQLDHKYSDDDYKIIDNNILPVEIPEPEVA